MKGKVRKTSVWILALMMAVVFAVPTQAFGTKFDPSPTAKDVKYIVDKNGKRTGIGSLKIGPYNYLNLSQDKLMNPKGEATVTLSKDLLREYTKTRLFPMWATIAEGVFNDQADQFVTIEGSKMMTSGGSGKNAFLRHFSYGKVGVPGDYAEYDWSLEDLSGVLQAREPMTKGVRCWDYAHSTGIVDVASLDAARTRMGQELRNHSDDDDNSVDDFLANQKPKNDPYRRLPAMEDKESGYGFANIVTCVNRAGASGDYDYDSFGLMIYDFKLVPLAAKELSYIEAAQEYVEAENPIKAAAEAQVPGVEYSESTDESVKFLLKNPSSGEATQTVTLENSVTEEVSNTFEQRKDYGFEESVGAEINFSQVCQVAPRASINFSVTASQMFGTTKSDTNTKSTTKTKSVSTELQMPQHTVAKVIQDTQNRSFKESYQTPTILSYKVAIFGMSGDFFNGWCGGIDKGQYDKQYMSLILKGADDAGISGHQALGSLYNRGVKNKGVAGYDAAAGDFSVWCDKDAWVKSESINWNNVNSALTDDNRTSHMIYHDPNHRMDLEDIATEIPILEKACEVSGKKSAVTSSVASFEPMYDLVKVRIKDPSSAYFDTKKYLLSPGRELPLDGVVLEGKNKDNWDFFGFDSEQLGYWVPCTKDGGERTQTDADAARVTKKEKGKFQRIVTNSTVEGPKTYWFKWKIFDDAEITSNEHPEGIKHESVEVPILEISIQGNTSIDDYDGKLTLEGEYSGLWSEPVNLAKELKVTVSPDKAIPLYWETMGSGISIDPNNPSIAVCKEPGIYKVRAYAISNQGHPIYSNFVDIQATAEPALSSFTLTAPEIPQALRTLTQKRPTLEWEASEWVRFFDQNGKEWLGDEPAVSWSVSDESIASIDSTGHLTVTGPGSVDVTASTENLGEKTVSLTILRDKWLAALELQEPDTEPDQLTLTDTVKQVRVQNLAGLLKYYDIDEEEWEGKKPKVTFQVVSGPEGGAIKNGNFVATQGGEYILQAVTSTGIESNSILVEVQDSSSLVLTTENPPAQRLADSDHPIAVQLENLVIAKTARGTDWYGDLPDLTFQLAEKTKDAAIQTKNIDGSDRDVFTCTKAGSYKVKVLPVDPKEYSQAIPDITIVAEGTYVQWGPWQKLDQDSHFRVSVDNKDITQEEAHTWVGKKTGSSKDPAKPDVVKFTCSKCGAEKEATVAHDWSKPTYKIDDSFDKVTAERHCQHEGCIAETETAEIEFASEFKNNIWTVSYFAKFKNPAFQFKVVDEDEGMQGEEEGGTSVLTSSLKAKGKTVKVKASVLKKKPVKIKASQAVKITAAVGTVTSKKGAVSPKNAKSYFKVNKKSGTITVKKGLKKGTYKLKLKLKASGYKKNKSKSKTVTVTIKVK